MSYYTTELLLLIGIFSIINISLLILIIKKFIGHSPTEDDNSEEGKAKPEGKE